MNTTTLLLGLDKWSPTLLGKYTKPRVSDEVTPDNRMQVTQKVMAALKDGCDTVWSISEETELTERTVKHLLGKLVDCGFVNRINAVKVGKPHLYHVA